ncbi:MAG: metallophosphoesterase [Treponemataceae bacterium]|nr:metallophosphoesterase [Treponemataceae bacterium]
MRRIAFLLIACAVFASSCSYGPYMFNVSETKVDERATSITDLNEDEQLNPPGNIEVFGETYTFLIIADPHTGPRVSGSVVKRFRAKYDAWINEAADYEKPRFIINLGDVLDSGKQSQADDYHAFMKQLDTVANDFNESLPHYSVIGNHDLYASDGWDVWARNFYPHTSYYRFKIDKFSYYFLDTGNGTLGKPQLEDLEKQLVDDKNAKIVLMHYPVVSDSSFCLQNTVERNRLLRDFADGNVKMIFSGHYHRGDTHRYGGMTEVTVKSFGFNGTALLVTVDNATQSITCQEINF